MKTKQLENYGVRTLGTREMKEMNGGIWPTVARYVIGALAGVALSQDLDALGDAFMEGWNDAK